MHYTNTCQGTRSGIRAAAIGILGGLVVAAAQAQIPVTDVAAQMQLSRIQQDTSKIKSDVIAIRDHTNKIATESELIRGNTDVMRAVMAEKQKFIMALNQMDLLHQTGLVLLKAAPTDQIMSEVTAMTDGAYTNTLTQPGSIGMPNMPTVGNPINSVRPFRDLSGRIRNAIGSGSNIGGSARNVWNSVQSIWANPGSTTPFTVLDLADSAYGVGDAAADTYGSVAGIFSSIEQVYYTGKRFIGRDWTNVDGIVGVRGVPISVDRTPPAVMMGADGSFRSALTDAASGFQSTKRAYLARFGNGRGTGAPGSAPSNPGDPLDEDFLGNVGPADGDGGDDPFAPAAAGFQAGTDAAARLHRYQVNEGIYLRPQSDLDGAYNELVANGTAAEQMAFWSATTYHHGTTYSPLVGNFHDGERVNPFNLNDTLSGGAFFAVEEYNALKGQSGNPYSDMARTLAPSMTAILAGTQQGQRLEVASDDIARAKKMQPVNLRAFKPLAYNPADLPESTMIAMARSGHFPTATVSAGGGTASSVVTVGLTDPEQDEFDGRILKSDIRLSENYRMMNICQSMLTYSNDAITAISRLRAALTGISSEMTELNAIETVPGLIMMCDQMILFLKRQHADYSLEIERLRKESNVELAARGNWWRKTEDMLRKSATTRINHALMSQKGTRNGITSIVTPESDLWAVAEWGLTPEERKAAEEMPGNPFEGLLAQSAAR